MGSRWGKCERRDHFEGHWNALGTKWWWPGWGGRDAGSSLWSSQVPGLFCMYRHYSLLRDWMRMWEKEKSRTPPIGGWSSELRELPSVVMGRVKDKQAWQGSRGRVRSGMSLVWAVFQTSRWRCGIGSWVEKSREFGREVSAADKGPRWDETIQRASTEGERLRGMRGRTLQRRLRNEYCYFTLQNIKIYNSDYNWSHCSRQRTPAPGNSKHKPETQTGERGQE